MPYADAVISESMRLHLPAPILGLTARKDVVVGGVTVPYGTNVFISQSKTAVSDDHFTNATQFWPEVSYCLLLKHACVIIHAVH
jgi:cytochrome P450